MDFAALSTERALARRTALDRASSLEIVTLMNEADRGVPAAVGKALLDVARAADGVAARLSGGGRLFYVGAGTSGRLGVLDAAECPPTFGCAPSLVQAVMAGGKEAVFSAAEALEDREALGAAAVTRRAVRACDAVVGISASGRTPFVLGALRRSGQRGALCIGVSCNRGAALSALSDLAIEVETGPEVLVGSTRLKAATAQKMVLNMLSTAVMARLGRVYGDLMVEARGTSGKLSWRAAHMVSLACGLGEREAGALLRGAGGDVKRAILMGRRGLGVASAGRLLDAAGGNLRKAEELFFAGPAGRGRQG